MSTKISQLTSATDITASDLIQIVDVEDGVMAPSGTNKKITAQLFADDLAGIVSNGSISTSKLSSGALPSGVTVSSTNIVNGTIVNADINASAAIDGSKVSPIFNSPSVVSVSSSSDALSVTQTGAGNSFVVNDASNPDATPFVIDSTGRVLIGSNTSIPVQSSSSFTEGIATFQQISEGAGIASLVSFNDASPSTYSVLALSRGRGNLENKAIIQNDDNLGGILFQGYDGDNLKMGAFIRSAIEGTPGNGSIPTRMTFGTLQDGAPSATQRMVIANDGNVGINTFTPLSKLHISGDLTMSSATVATSAVAGNNEDVPAQVAGYLVVNINGIARKIPYYA